MRLLTCLTLLLSILLIPARGQVSTCERSLGEAYLDVNSVRARLLNTGGLFYRGEPHVYNVPRFTESNALFASGIWIIGEVDGELRGSASRYGEWELWAGPLDNGQPPADCSEYDRIYSVRVEDLFAYDATGIATSDLMDWPWELGAPVIDGDGNPDNYNLEGGDRPEVLGHQTAWWVMNDRGNIHESTDLPPMGLEVQVTAFAANSNIPAISNATLYKYRLINESGERIENAYFGIFSDPDLGDFADDYVGSDSTLNLGYVYNADNVDGGGEGYGTPPPALGYDIIQGPLANTDGLDNDGDGEVDELDERQGMHAFVFYNGGGGINEDPQTGMDYHLYMQGRWKDGRRIFYGGDGFEIATTNRPTTFMYSGDPITQEGWSERSPSDDGSRPPNSPGDRRFVMSTGPFTLEPGASEDIVFSIVWARGEDNWDSIRAMKEASEVVEEAYLDGFNLTNLPLPEPNIKEAPIQWSPANFTTNQPLNIALRWREDSLAEAYEIHLSQSPDFIERETAISSLTTSLDLKDLIPFTTYFWRVRSLNYVGAGPWSKTFQFKTSDFSLPQRLSPIQGFMTVANAAGPLNPPDMGAFAFNRSGFPVLEGALTPEGSYPTADRPTRGVQQSTNESAWGIHAAGDNPLFKNPDDCEDCTPSFLDLVVPDGWDAVGLDDYEWRFTQECLDRMDGTIEEGDCLARRLFEGGDDVEVPFELWNVGETADSTDDYRMIPVLCEETCNTGLEPGVFDFKTDHPISGGDDDPYSDAVFWYKPEANGETAGEEGYRGYFAGTAGLGEVTFSNMVLVQWNGGSELPYVAELPEPGTVFRMVLTGFPTPLLSAPNNGSIASTTRAGLYWSSVSPDYQVQVDTSPAFDSPIVDTTGIGAFEYVFDQAEAGQVYYWRVRAIAFPKYIASDWSETWSFTALASGVASDEESLLPAEFVLEGNYPNPFSSSTRIRYALPVQSSVRLEVFDVLGRRVAILANEPQDAGWHEVSFDAQHIPAGLYLYRLTAGSFTKSRTMIHVH